MIFLLLHIESLILCPLYLKRDCLIKMVNGWMVGSPEEKELLIMTI
jgi:hypothetical protein